ncbi:MAG: helix-turn-helix domain-containing protein [Planctomycetota bacterium]|jgi:DNA-binding IclR family transcriptional regulator|nr:helix-turn-helix domain-containing protein [Planctomycetota bacterium]
MPKASQPHLSLINGLAVLEAVLAAPTAVGSRELARCLGLDRSVTNRLLLTLASQGMLLRTPRGRYVPGHGVHGLAAISLRSSGLLTHALPLAEQWLDRGCRFTLGVLWRHHLCHLIVARPGQALNESLGAMPPGDPFVSTAGVVLLAQAEGDMVAKALSAWPMDAALAQRRLDAARSSGYASHTYDDGTRSLGVAVGAPALAAIAVSHQDWTDLDVTAVVGELTQQAAALAVGCQDVASTLSPVTAPAD